MRNEPIVEKWELSVIPKLLLFREEILPRILHNRMERLTFYDLELRALLLGYLNAGIHHIARESERNVVPEGELFMVIVGEEVLSHAGQGFPVGTVGGLEDLEAESTNFVQKHSIIIMIRYITITQA